MRLCNLLVGWDESVGAEAALAFALHAGQRRGATVTLLHACAPGDGDAEIAWRRRLEDLVERADVHAEVRRRVERGRPAETLLSSAAADDVDAILVGAHGGRGLGALLGRTPQQLLARASCSVIMFPGPVERAGPVESPTYARPRPRAAPERDGAPERDEPPEQDGARSDLPRSVLVGVDGSPESRDALRLAEALAVVLSAKLTLVHVHNPLLSVAAGAGEQAAAGLRLEAERILRAARSTVAAPLDAVDSLILEGDPRQQLLNAAALEPAAMLVVGSRGRGGFAGLALGSTAAWTASHAHCPVAVARERESRA